VVADLLHTMTGPEEWYRFRTVFFGSPDNRHNQHNLRVSLCLYDSVVRMCNTLSALPFDQAEDLARSLQSRAATLRDRARLRIRWRRTARPLRRQGRPPAQIDFFSSPACPPGPLSGPQKRYCP